MKKDTSCKPSEIWNGSNIIWKNGLRDQKYPYRYRGNFKSDKRVYLSRSHSHTKFARMHLITYFKVHEGKTDRTKRKIGKSTLMGRDFSISLSVIGRKAENFIREIKDFSCSY